VVGVGQVNQRDVAPSEARSPVGLFVDAARVAGDESHGLLARCDTVAVVLIGSWRYPDPGATAADELGIEPRSTVRSSLGGNSPQLLVNEMAADIARGQRDVVLIGGGEVLRTRRRARQLGVDLEFEAPTAKPCSTIIGIDKAGTNDIENAHGAYAPTQVYPLFETALRAAAERSIDEHQRHIGELWAGFSDAAAGNPHAWSRRALTPNDIVDVTTDNRMVTSPYTKRMNSNVDVDQGAALVLASYEAARAAGVPDDQLVFLHAGADAHDHWWVSERASLAESVAIGVAARAALDAASIGIDDVARFDLYSCFPSAVQMAMHSIGLIGPAGGDERPLTVTGGLSFGGGPLNNYPTHAMARMTELLRADPGSFGLTTAIGWYATKHSCGVWSTTPPTNGFVRVDPTATQAVVDAAPRREYAARYDGQATVEATAVPFDREGNPTVAIVTALSADGRRVWANVTDRDAMLSMTSDPWEGRVASIAAGDPTNRVEDLR
jgi:acetyl-CoA C-acetyltransferase